MRNGQNTMMESYRAVLFDLFGTLVNERGEAIDGAREVLAALPPAHWAIVTSCPGRLARDLVAHAGLTEPGVLVSSDDVSQNKPAPEGYLLAARRLSVEPADCLVVEDSFAGVAAGRAAGMDVVNVGEVEPAPPRLGVRP